MILTTEGLTKNFGGLMAIDNVSINIEQGNIFGIIGPNGAGKTTFLNCICGFYKPQKGKIVFKGEDITGLLPHQLFHKGISRTFQVTRSFPKLSALDNVKLAVVYGGKKYKNPEKRAAELMDFVAFPMSKKVLAQNFNTMQLKKLELARALANDCELIFLDEIAAGLIPSELEDFIKLLRRIRDSGVTIISIEHVMKFTMRVCDRIAVLQFGKKIAEGTPKEIKNNPKVIEGYLGEEQAH